MVGNSLSFLEICTWGKAIHILGPCDLQEWFFFPPLPGGIRGTELSHNNSLVCPSFNTPISISSCQVNDLDNRVKNILTVRIQGTSGERRKGKGRTDKGRERKREQHEQVQNGKRN